MTELLQSREPRGSALAARRNELQMSLAQVAGRLLLSQRHVEALEADDASAFYNQNFFEQARRRYAGLLGLATPGTLAPLDAEVSPPAPTLPHAAANARAEDPIANDTRPARTRLTIGFAMAAIVAIGLLAFKEETPRSSPVAEAPPAPAARLPETPAQTTNTKPLAEPAREKPVAIVVPPLEPASRTTEPEPRPAGSAVLDQPADEVPPQGGPIFEFEATRLAWVFAREAGGKETQRTLKAGQRLVLTGPLSYLAVGDLSAVRILVDGERRDIGTFSSDGRVARLGPPELRSLRAASSPASPNHAPERSDVEVGHP